MLKKISRIRAGFDTGAAWHGLAAIFGGMTVFCVIIYLGHL